MSLSHRPAPRLVVVLAALAMGLLAAVVTVAGARDSGPPPATVRTQDDQPRNPAAEAATGDTDAMLAVVQEIVDCLRDKGYDPGDPRVVRGTNVVMTGWNPAWDSAAARAEQECALPVR